MINIPKISLGPTGNTIHGHVLDCGRAPLEARMREYDAQLYITWNPRKLRGWGCWEVRRRPEFKSVKEVCIYGGNTYVVLDYKESGFENHIFDVPYLNYKILDRLSEIDTWKKSYKAKNFGQDLDAWEQNREAQIRAKAEEERAYAIKQHKSLIRDLMDYVNEGGNPARVADAWDKAQ